MRRKLLIGLSEIWIFSVSDIKNFGYMKEIGDGIQEFHVSGIVCNYDKKGGNVSFLILHKITLDLHKILLISNNFVKYNTCNNLFKSYF